MLKLIKIAVTGGVASGKSTVCQFFKELGACVVSADALSHELLDPNTNLGQQIIQLLGPDIQEDGKISRRIIADKVFREPKRLEQLEKLLHPAILRKIEENYRQACEKGGYTSFVVEIPLLYEIGAEGFYDVVVAVFTDEAVARKRFEKGQFQKTEYDRRMNRQLKPHQKAAQANFTIYNNGSLDDLRREVTELNQRIHKNLRNFS